MAKEYMDNINKARQKIQKPKVNTTPLVTRTTPGKTPSGQPNVNTGRQVTRLTPGTATKKPIGTAGIASGYAAKKAIAKPKAGMAKKKVGGGTVYETPGFKPSTRNRKKF